MRRKQHRNVLFLGGPYMFQFYRHITLLARARNWYLQPDERYNPPRNWRGDGVLSMHLDVPAMNTFMDDVLARGIPVVDLLDVTSRTDIGRVATDLLQRMMDGKCARDAAVRVPPLGIAVRRSTDALAVADPTLRKAVTFISSNIARPFGPSQVAQSLGMPLARLNAISQRELGRSMLGEIARQRTNEAKRLIKETDAKLSTVARLAGFCNASYFCKTFREATGLTPHAWRRQADSEGACRHVSAR